MNTRIYTPESLALAKICREWYVSFGTLAFAVLISLWVSPLWMPLIELGLAVLLAVFGPGRNLRPGHPCGRMTLLTVYILMFTGLISFGINIAYRTAFIHIFFDISTLNHSIPYITALVIYPVCAIFAGFASFPAVHKHHIKLCYLHNHYNPTHPVFGRIVHGTYLSMTRLMTLLAVVISVVDWGYYFLGYNNASLNTPDRFFFFIVPAAIYIWSLIYVHNNYSALKLSNGRTIHAFDGEEISQSDIITDSSVVRFLVIQNDCLLLNISEESFTECNVDTPYSITKPLSYNINDESAGKDFQLLSGESQFTLKHLYTNRIAIGNITIHHYAVFIDAETETNGLRGQWSPLDSVDRMLKMGVLSSTLADEIYRIYTISLAWKTYDANGRRKFPISNYQPNFHLNEIHQLGVDFNDDRWLKISKINQDRPFWFIRRLFI